MNECKAWHAGIIQRGREREITHKLVKVGLLGSQSHRKAKALGNLPGVRPNEVEPDHLHEKR